MKKTDWLGTETRQPNGKGAKNRPENKYSKKTKRDLRIPRTNRAVIFSGISKIVSLRFLFPFKFFLGIYSFKELFFASFAAWREMPFDFEFR